MMKKIFSKKLRTESQKQYTAKLKRNILEALSWAGERQIEEAMNEFAENSKPQELFNLSLSVVKKFESCGTHCIARAATSDARAWLQSRIKKPVVQEAMEVWLLSERIAP